jgi:hypothetical protein
MFNRDDDVYVVNFKGDGARNVLFVVPMATAHKTSVFALLLIVSVDTRSSPIRPPEFKACRLAHRLGGA